MRYSNWSIVSAVIAGILGNGYARVEELQFFGPVTINILVFSVVLGVAGGIAHHFVRSQGHRLIGGIIGLVIAILANLAGATLFAALGLVLLVAFAAAFITGLLDKQA